MNVSKTLFVTALLLGPAGSAARADDAYQSYRYAGDTDRQRVKPAPDPVNLERRTQDILLDLTLKKLKLSPDQETALRAAFQEQNIRTDTALREFMDKIKAIEDDKDGKVLATLNDVQKKKYQEAQDKAQTEAGNEAAKLSERGLSGHHDHSHHGGTGSGGGSGDNGS